MKKVLVVDGAIDAESKKLLLEHWRRGQEIDMALTQEKMVENEAKKRGKIIPIVIGHDHAKMIGTLEDGVVTFLPGQKITPLDLVAIMGSCSYHVLEHSIDGDKMYIQKVSITHFSFEGK